MTIIRRLYILLVCAVSLQTITWAFIALLWNLLPPGAPEPVQSTALQMALLIVGLPFFLVHWLWAQRLARQDTEERQSALRRLYLYGMSAAFLVPLVGQSVELLSSLMRLGLGPQEWRRGMPLDEAIVNAIIAICVLAALWGYQRWIILGDARIVPETGHSADVRRFYLMSFSSAGLAMASGAAVGTLRWILLQLEGKITSLWAGPVALVDSLSSLLVGLTLWLAFWVQVQRLFATEDVAERESLLRKVYLYAAVLIGCLVTVASATAILAGFIRSLLGLPASGDISDPLSLLIVAAVLWAYHAFVLRGDEARAGEAPRQAGVRRLYLYIVAAVGLAAFLVGLAGVVSVLIRLLSGDAFGTALKEQLAWCTAALAAGLPVWLWPWRRAQIAAEMPGSAGAVERQSVVRKLYLWFYLFVATMTALGSAVLVLWESLYVALGGTDVGNLVSDLGQGIAFSLIAVGVWLYHGRVLRGDGRMSQQERADRASRAHVVVLDLGEGQLGRAVVGALGRAFPGLNIHPLGLTPAAATAMGATEDSAALAAHVVRADIIITPSAVSLPEQTDAWVVQAIAASPARKLLLPSWDQGWDWAGVERLDAEVLALQAAQAVGQILEGGEVKRARPLGTAAIVGLAVLALFVVFALLMALLSVVGPLMGGGPPG